MHQHHQLTVWVTTKNTMLASQKLEFGDLNLLFMHVRYMWKFCSCFFFFFSFFLIQIIWYASNLNHTFWFNFSLKVPNKHNH